MRTVQSGPGADALGESRAALIRHHPSFDNLMKPCDIDELLYKIQDACEKKRIQQAKIDQVQDTIDREE